MKSLKKIGVGALGLLLVISCSDYEALEFQVDKPESVILQEELNEYDALKSYLAEESSDFILGAATDIAQYNSEGLMYRLINRNFHEVTPGYGMKHGALVRSDGTLDLTGLTEFLERTEAAGVSVFGHTLTWHANQNATYLNGLIAPIAVTTPGFANELDLQFLRDGSFMGWTYDSQQVSLAEGEGMGNDTDAIGLEAGPGVSSPEDLRLSTPAIPVVQDHEYEVVFYVKSDQPGEGSVSFEGMINNKPVLDYDNDGIVDSTFTTSTSWKEVRFKINGFEQESFEMNLNFGYASDVTYFLDIENFYVYDTQGDPLVNNLVLDGDFESGSAWGGWGNDAQIGITEDGMGYGNQGRALYVTNPSLTEGFWEVQTLYELPEPLENGETYELSFWVKGTAPGVIRPEFQSPDYSSNGLGQVYVTQEWQRVELSTNVSADDRGRLIFSYGEFAGTVYIDDVVLKSASASSGGETTIVEKTQEEKEGIIRSALERWIAEIMGAAQYVHAWDVVNEPMDDANPFELKSGEGRELASDEFFWQDYLGKDYAVEAFKLAREYGDPEDLLFINDYNLEYSLDKTRGIIQLVEYIESQGARVDGIGTQMHININSSKENIDEMFRLLAATGKLIKVSELDVAVQTKEPTAEILAQQASMYRYVVESFAENVPADQRYGITVWGVQDSSDDASWMPGERQGLWDLNFNRKPAYGSFAQALEDL